MGPGAGINYHSIDLFEVGLMDLFAECSFMIRLKDLQLDAQFLRKSLEFFIDFIERDRSILSGISLAEHVEIDAVQHQYLLHDFAACTDFVLNKDLLILSHQPAWLPIMVMVRMISASVSGLLTNFQKNRGMLCWTSCIGLRELSSMMGPRMTPKITGPI